MKLLLDTHTFIWWDGEPDKLSPQVLAMCRDQANLLLVSIASLWEIQIKYQLGKLNLKLPLGQIITNQQQNNNIVVLPVTLDHILALETLPHHHRDPFDRLLIAQATLESATLLSKDSIFANYQVNLLW